MSGFFVFREIRILMGGPERVEVCDRPDRFPYLPDFIRTDFSGPYGKNFRDIFLSRNFFYPKRNIYFKNYIFCPDY